MRFAASMFVSLLKTRPGLETAAFVIVGWVGVKLALYTLAHEELGIIPADVIHSAAWKIIFWAVLAAIAVCGWFMSGAKQIESGAESEKGNTRKMIKKGVWLLKAGSFLFETLTFKTYDNNFITALLQKHRENPLILHGGTKSCIVRLIGLS